jgi:hypothetical protein
LKSRESNELNIHCLEHGQRELFFTTGDLKAAETTVTAVPRYFSFGQDVIDIKLQMSILRSVTGEDPYLDRETAINRGSLWKGWYLNKARESRQFVLHHLPIIARKYVHVWGLEFILVDDNDVISQHFLRQIDDQIRKLIHYSNQAPVAQLRTSGALPMDSSTTKNPSRTKNKANLPPEVESPPKRIRRASSLLLPNLPGALPSSLKAVELKDITLNELAAVEHCLWLLQQQRMPLSEVALKESAELLGLTVKEKQLMPTSISLLELTELLPSQASRAMTNVKSARKSLLNAMVDMIGTNLFLSTCCRRHLASTSC